MEPTRQVWVLPLNDEEKSEAPSNREEEAIIQQVGGKGANLLRLFQAGFPVPEGFLVTTQAYRSFLHANNLETQILAALPGSEDSAQLEAASTHIRALFRSGSLPSALSEAILASYRRLGSPPVAVRSSATAEDLPEMSFAGQQDTFLNVEGQENLLQAIVDCWSSLWTARAISYRMHNRVAQTGVALAVVVQKMVQSQVSGVLFTANPLSGVRSETVIDAAFGLGEALVSGQVEPDHYVVDRASSLIRSKTLGAKATAIHGLAGGGTSVVTAERGGEQALPDEQILRLSGLGQQVAELYGSPQDIEWALVDHSLYLLQARPVTSLFPIPERIPEGQLKVLFSFAAVQGIMDPITPLGRDMICTIFAVGASLFGVQATSETQTALYTAGERLWGNITPLVRNSVGRRIFSAALGMVEPSVQQALLQIQDDPRLQPDRPGVSFAAVRQLLRFFLPVASNVFLNLLRPKERREMIVGNGERVLAKLQRRCTAIQGDRYERLAQQADLLPRLIREELPRAFILFVSSVAAAMASFNLLGRLAAGEAVSSQDLHDLVLEATRGVPHNPTTEMDLELWRAASEIRRDPASCELFRAGSPAELSARFLREELPQVAQKAVAGFLEKYGQRGLGEIDLGRARWREDPTPIFESLSGYLQIEAEEQAPDAVYARGARNAETAVDRLVETIRRRRFGWLKARLARFFASRMRELMGTRESPKFFVVRMMGLQRQELLKSGSEFVQAGELSQADDLFFLTFSELRRLAAHEESDWQARIERRREAYNRELMRRQVPRLLLSDGRAFYEGVAVHEHQAGKLAGSPVSPGSVEGAVRVVFDPRRANLQPGEILVCPGTDPSWTPLFLTAAGLVMETGGMMTHGAVVAREYGIPAVVGVDRATSRLQTGQRIQLNGSTGEITLLDSLP